jgi:hypothetical protein
MQQTAEKQKPISLNGVNVEQLFGNIDAIKNAPVLGKFKFRANNKWIHGGHNQTTIKNFHGIQQEHDHDDPFVLDADEPPLLLGEDKGPNPVEYALTALAACVTTALVYHAAAKGIKLNAVEARLEGDIDLRGFLGISDDVRSTTKSTRMFLMKSWKNLYRWVRSTRLCSTPLQIR